MSVWRDPAHAPWRLLALAVLGACLLALVAGCDDTPSRAKKMNTVRLLPDTPPPPPPPPKPEEKKPEPQKEDKPQPQLAQPKPAEAPQPQALKSDEAAGEGPGNGLQAGSVTQDYTQGQIGNGTGGTDDGANRLVLNTYANAAKSALNTFLSRDKGLKQRDYRVQVHLWLEPDGRTQRAELMGSTGDPDTDAALRAALARFPGTAAPLPAKLPQPMRFQVSNRMMS